MGVIYSIACRQCKVVRDLDKYYGAREVSTRAEALAMSDEIQKNGGDAFRAALLVSFMTEHFNHDCVFFNEHSACSEELDPFENVNGYEEDKDLWRE